MSFVKRYFAYLRPHLWAVLGIFLGGLVFVAFTGVSFWMAADFVQALFRGNIEVPPLPEGPLTPDSFIATLKHHSARLVAAETPFQTLQRAILFIVGAFFVKNVALYIQMLLSARVEQRIAQKMRDQLYDRLLAQDLAFFHRRQTGDLVAAGVNDITQLNAGLSEAFAKLVRDPVNVLMFLLLLLAISWKMTLATIAIAPLAGIITGLAGVSLKRKSRRTQARVGVVSATLNEVLYGMRIVQAYGGQERERGRFFARTEDHFRQALGRERLRRLISPLNEMSGILVITAILLIAGGRVLGGDWLPAGDFVRFLVLIFGLLTPLVSLGEVQARLKVAEGAASRVFDLLDTHHEIDEVARPGPVEGFRDGVRLEGVSLEYGDDRGAALRNVDLTIRKGERVVLVGRSGSGKSSIINLLPRFYDPTSGRITLDGTDIRELEIEPLRALFGIVSQEIVLFHDTVRNNIAYGVEATDDEVERAARAAAAHGFITELPQGYETDLGDLGGRLSGGQRQRIAIARAVLRDPPLLLLDEPTSALDADVADEIQETLDEVGRGRTVITATHRLASLREDDRIVLLEEGRIVADGLHRELMERDEDYRTLVRRQLAAP